jgi:hypothetical protein
LAETAVEVMKGEENIVLAGLVAFASWSVTKKALSATGEESERGPGEGRFERRGQGQV